MTTPLEQRIAKSIAANPNHADWQIAKNVKTTSAQVAAVRAKIGTLDPSQPEPTLAIPGGVSLSSKRVLPRKPPESAAKFIKRLPKNRGFTPAELAALWGMAEETVRRHAKDLGCFKFVEVSEDEWVPMIMHPDTAAQY
jgi:hypothetical protein